MKGLMLHCGGQLKTRGEVFAVPAPAATSTYAPLPYESFISRIEKQLAVEERLFFDRFLLRLAKLRFPLRQLRMIGGGVV